MIRYSGLLAVLAHVVLSAQAASPDGLVLRLAFDGDALDSSGCTNHGTLSGATFVPGVQGSALHFDGTDDYVRVATSADLQSPTFTAMAWVQSEEPAPSADRGVLGKHREHENISYYWLYQSSNEVRATMVGSTYGALRHASSAASPMASQWAHLALSYDGLAMRLYVNGAQVSAQTVSGYAGNQQDLLIGAGEFSWFTGAPQRCWKGLVDEVRIYNRALTTNEILALSAGQTNSTPATGAVRCNLGPQGAIDAGARWRLGSEPPGVWHASGDVVAALDQGSYEVQFKYAPGWVTPAARSIFVEAGQTQVVSSVWAPEPQDGLVLRFDFSQTNGGYLPDLSGMNNSGRVSGATLQTGGVAGLCARFNGTGDYIQVRNSSSLVSSNFSVVAWVLAEDALPALDRGVVGKHKAFDNVSYYWLYQSGAEIRGTMVGSSLGAYVHVTNSSAACINQWAHLALTHSGGVMRLYVNGAEVSARSVAGYRGNNYDLLVGAGEWASSGSLPQRWWKGLMDELRIYNRGLSAGEVSLLYSGQTIPPVQHGSLRVQIEPAGAAAVGAWRTSSEADGTWHASGTVLTNVLAGIHPIVFRPAPGWAEPAGVSATVVASSTSVVTGRYAYVSTNDLVLYFDFNEAPATNLLTDKSGYGNNGIVSNVVFEPNGYRNGAYFFNGSNSFVVVPDDDSYDKTSFTICVWAKSAVLNLTADAGIIGKHREGYNTSYYWLYQGAAINYGSNVLQSTMVGSQSGQFRHIGCPAAPVVSNWALTTLTYDRSQMKLYVNGALIGTQTFTGYVGNAYNLLVGAGEWKLSNAGVPQRFWNGWLDEVKIYRRVLTSNEIGALYATNVPTDVIPPVIVDINPPDRHVTTESGVTMQITVEDNVGVVAVTVNNLPAEPQGNNRWKYRQDELEVAENTFVVVARDEQGNTATQSVSYTRGTRLNLATESDGQWLVVNQNDFAVGFEWEVLQGTESGTGVVAAASSGRFLTSVGPKAVRLTVNGYLQDIRSWNPKPVIGHGNSGTAGSSSPTSRNRLTDAGAGYGDVLIWESVPGQSYEVQSSTDVLSGNWLDVPGGYYLGDGGVISHTNAILGSPAFFRIKVGNIFW